MGIASLIDTYYLNETFLDLLRKKRNDLSKEKSFYLKKNEPLAKILNNESFYHFLPGLAPAVTDLKFNTIFDTEGFLFPTDVVEIKIYFNNILIDEKNVSLLAFYDFYTQIRLPQEFDQYQIIYRIIPQKENDYIKVLEEEVNETLVLRVLRQVLLIFHPGDYHWAPNESTKGKSVFEDVNFLINILKRDEKNNSFYIYQLIKFSKSHDLYDLLKMFSKKMEIYQNFSIVKWWYRRLIKRL